ncbi:TPA: hypothetical protein ACH3X2_14292 [Trebouxia sp. C0005]
MQLQSILQLGPNIQTHTQNRHTHKKYHVQKQPAAADTILPTIDIAADAPARSEIPAFSFDTVMLSSLPCLCEYRCCIEALPMCARLVMHCCGGSAAVPLSSCCCAGRRQPERLALSNVQG